MQLTNDALFELQTNNSSKMNPYADERYPIYRYNLHAFRSVPSGPTAEITNAKSNTTNGKY